MHILIRMGQKVTKLYYLSQSPVFLSPFTLTADLHFPIKSESTWVRRPLATFWNKKRKIWYGQVCWGLLERKVPRLYFFSFCTSNSSERPTAFETRTEAKSWKCASRPLQSCANIQKNRRERGDLYPISPSCFKADVQSI